MVDRLLDLPALPQLARQIVGDRRVQGIDPRAALQDLERLVRPPLRTPARSRARAGRRSCWDPARARPARSSPPPPGREDATSSGGSHAPPARAAALAAARAHARSPRVPLRGLPPTDRRSAGQSPIRREPPRTLGRGRSRAAIPGERIPPRAGAAARGRPGNGRRPRGSGDNRPPGATPPARLPSLPPLGRSPPGCRRRWPARGRRSPSTAAVRCDRAAAPRCAADCPLCARCPAARDSRPARR